MTARWAAIDVSDSEDQEDIGRGIGDHQIPVGTLKTDPEPNRAVFASLGLRGEMNITVYPIDKRFRPFVPTDEHEKHVTSFLSTVESSQWMEQNIKRNRKIADQTIVGVRRYVFEQMGSTEAGRA